MSPIKNLGINGQGMDAATVNRLLGEGLLYEGYYYAQLMRQSGGVVL